MVASIARIQPPLNFFRFSTIIRMNMFTVKMDSETAQQLHSPMSSSSSPVSLAVHSAAASERAPEQGLKPKSLEPKEAMEEGEETHEKERLQQHCLEMIAKLSLEPFKLLQVANRVLVSPGDTVPMVIEVKLDYGKVFILEGDMEVLRGTFVGKADQLLQDTDLMLGITPVVKVYGLLFINPQILQKAAQNCGLVDVSAEVSTLFKQRIKVTPQSGHFAKPARKLLVLNDLPLLVSGRLQAHPVHEVEESDSDRKSG
jgi:AraC-like DNA-binding protein